MRINATGPAATILALTGAAAAQPNFLGLGDLPGGIFQSEAFGVSPDGSVVVGASVGGAGADACYWTWDEGLVSIGDLPGGERLALAQAASMGGAVVVGYSRVAVQNEAFRWTLHLGMVGMGGSDSSARDVSWDGEVVVGTMDWLDGRAAFRWTEATGMVPLGWLSEEHYAAAYRCSADGSVVVGVVSFPGNTHEPFRWTAGTGMVGLGVLPASSTGACKKAGVPPPPRRQVKPPRRKGFSQSRHFDTPTPSLSPDLAAIFTSIARQNHLDIAVPHGILDLVTG